jgi:hypothetical protein
LTQFSTISVVRSLAPSFNLLNINQNLYFQILAFTLQPLTGEPDSTHQICQTKKDSSVIKLLYIALLGSALILSLYALWLAVKELMTD